jgi:serine/threonine protein kinase
MVQVSFKSLKKTAMALLLQNTDFSESDGKVGQHTTPEKVPEPERVPEAVPSVSNLFDPESKALLWSPSQLKGMPIGDFTVVDMIADSGNHGLVLSCTGSQQRLYAMKIEKGEAEIGTDTIAFSQISSHPAVKTSEDLFIPQFIEAFKEEGKEIIVMELLGPDLFTLKTSGGRKRTSIKTALQVGLSAVTAYEQMHSAGWLHLTTKPINFCIGGTAETKHKAYVIDFGRAQEYLIRDSAREQHRPQGAGEAPGFYYYTSIWSDQGLTNSRRCDIMSLAWMLFDLVGERSPWERFDLNKADYVDMLCSNALSTAPTELSTLQDLVVYAAKLGYAEQPDYDLIRENFRKGASALGIELDNKYDWDDDIHEDTNGRIVLKV